MSQHLLKPPGLEGMVTSTRFTRRIAAQHVPSWHCPEGQGVGQRSPKDPFLPGAPPAHGGGHWVKKTLQRCWGHCGGKEPCKDRERGPAASWLHPASPCRGPRAIQPFSLPSARRPHGKRIKVHDKPGQDQHRAAQPCTGSVPPAPALWGNVRLLSPPSPSPDLWHPHSRGKGDMSPHPP